MQLSTGVSKRGSRPREGNRAARGFLPSGDRFQLDDPIGFDAGDANLYRYVGNSPTNASDSSGLAEHGTWDFWGNRPRAELDISGTTNTRFVAEVIKKLDTDFSLDKIPWVDARYTVFDVTGNYTVGRRAPAERLVTADRAGDYKGHPNARTGSADERRPWITPAQLARINIRVNLLSLKQDIVTEVFRMLRDTTPVGPGIPAKPDRKDLEQAANDIADAYIRAVDRFLKDHPGAKPRLGARNAIADAMGLQNEVNAPWCADWVGPIHSAIIDVKSKYIGVDHGQYKEKGLIWDTEHNFAIVRPRGYTPKFLPTLDPVILLFDPWRDLLPRVYHPSQRQDKMYAPTNTYP